MVRAVKKGLGPKGEKLPPGLSYDPIKRRWRVQHGGVRESAGTSKGAAIARLRELRDGRKRRAKRITTLAQLAEHWHERRDGLATQARSFEQFRIHIAPTLGHLRPDEVRRGDVLDVLHEASRSGLSASSVHNLNATLSSIYRHGLDYELCDSNPCAGIQRGLPPRRNQKRPCFTMPEALSLIDDSRIPEDWRLFHALGGLAGLRCGERCGLRWRDYQSGSLMVRCQYDGKPLKTSRGDLERPRSVPVHPLLASKLAQWKLSGWARDFGRAPRDGDYVIPDKRTLDALTPGIATKITPRHCGLVGIENKGSHGLRRFFITEARAAGASKEIVERITHNAQGDMVDRYTDADRLWRRLVEAVNGIKLERTPARTRAL